jgi:hypothetical protein
MENSSSGIVNYYFGQYSGARNYNKTGEAHLWLSLQPLLMCELIITQTGVLKSYIMGFNLLFWLV